MREVMDAATVAHHATKPLLRGWSHAVSAVVVAALCGVMIGLAPDAGVRAAMAVYAVGVTAMFATSALYHRGRWGTVALGRMKALDHSAIFIGIAGTYTPIAIVCLDGSLRIALLGLVWAGAVVGVALVWAPVELPRWLSTAVYALVGWAAVIALPDLARSLGAVGFGLVLGGGVAYTAGAVVYATRRPDPWPRTFGFHEIFHAFTIAGAGLHLAAVGLVVLPRA